MNRAAVAWWFVERGAVIGATLVGLGLVALGAYLYVTEYLPALAAR